MCVCDSERERLKERKRETYNNQYLLAKQTSGEKLTSKGVVLTKTFKILLILNVMLDDNDKSFAWYAQDTNS